MVLKSINFTDNFNRAILLCFRKEMSIINELNKTSTNLGDKISKKLSSILWTNNHDICSKSCKTVFSRRCVARTKVHGVAKGKILYDLNNTKMLFCGSYRYGGSGHYQNPSCFVNFSAISLLSQPMWIWRTIK